AFVVGLRQARGHARLYGYAAAVYRGTAVALIRHRDAVDAVLHRAEAGVAQLVFLGLGFLQADDVGVLLREPVEKPLVRGGADAVGVEADDAHAVDHGRRRASLAKSAAARSAAPALVCVPAAAPIRSRPAPIHVPARCRSGFSRDREPCVRGWPGQRSEALLQAIGPRRPDAADRMPEIEGRESARERGSGGSATP